MLDSATIALSAATTGIAVTGALCAIRSGGDKKPRLYLFIIFVLFAGITSLPLVIVFVLELYVFHVAAILPMLLILPPTIYHYIVARTGEDRSQIIPWRDRVLPLAGLLVTFGYWLLPKTPRATMLIHGELPPGSIPAALALAAFVLILLWSIASVGYLVASLRRLRAFREQLKNVYSNTNTFELRWIDWLMVFLVALWGASALSLVSDNMGWKSLFSVELIFILAAALLLFLIAFISTPPQTETWNSTTLSHDPDNAPISKYERSALSSDHAKRLATRIEKAMREDALYLDANLSLMKLSRHVGALPNMVSQTLNEEIGSTFYDYIAHWRINAAKPRILAREDSILTISLEAGFNSRSTFYKAFKKDTGMTPKAYRDTGKSTGS